jgi:tRNA pseudouridine55 synthase
MKAMKKKKTGPTPHGILLVNKEVGLTSFQVVARLRHALHTRAIGHAGTLDPLADGLMVILVGQYTRLSSYLTADDKRYVAAVHFTGRTNTDDAEGQIIESADSSPLKLAKIKDMLATMLGKQMQVPPIFSAIQINGERLYKKARRGEDVEIPPREVTFHELNLVSYDDPVAIVDVHCSKGTYVRALARDLGNLLGVPAHLGGLKRVQSGAYTLAEAHNLSYLMESDNARNALRVGPEAVLGMPILQIDEHDAKKLSHGQRISPPTELRDETVYLACHEERLVALVQQKSQLLHCLRGFGDTGNSI